MNTPRPVSIGAQGDLPLMCLRTCSTLRLFAALSAALLAGAASAQSLTLAADTTSAPWHFVVHLTASAAPAGNVTFADKGTPIATIPVSPQGTAVLGIATLAPGTHSLTAASALATSPPVALSITAAPASIQLSADNTILFQGNPINLAVAALPPLATGTITWSDGLTTFSSDTINRSPAQPTYQAFGDSITIGLTLANPANSYPSLFAAANGFTSYQNFADSGAASCDVLAHYILPVAAGPTLDASPLYSLMIGSSDMDNLGVPLGEPNFIACHQAALAWLAIPREYKILPGDPAAAILSGLWSLPPAQFDSTYRTLYNSAGTGAAAFTLTSNGGPLYLWYLIGDHLTGSFTVSLDGTPTGTTYTTNPATPIRSRNNPDSTGFVLLRLPVAPGPHTLRVDIVSGTVGILAAATPPSPGDTRTHPTVLATDVPNQNAAQFQASPATIAEYTADALADIALLQSDGLDLRLVPTHTFLTSDPANFVDFAHPSILGHQALFAAFQAAFAGASTDPYQTRSSSIPRAAPLLETLGLRTLAATYSGDPFYAATASSVNVNVIPDSHSLTTLTAPNTTFTAGQPVPATATVFPPNPGATVALMEAGQVLATAAVAYNTAPLTVASLAPGLHTVYAVYAGDANNAASVSPPLSILIQQRSNSITLTPSAAELAYAAPLTLAATLTSAAATGTVLFTDTWAPNGQVNAQAVQTLGQATLTAGTATFALPTLAPGTHTFTALYSGDTNDTAATSASATTLIDTIPTATTLAAGPAVFGQPTTFNAILTPADATGTVTFTDSPSGTHLQAALQNGTATWVSSTLTAGPHTVAAAYSGDSTHTASTSPPAVVTIARDPATLTLTAPVATLYAGHPLMLSATIVPAAATGTVLFTDATAGVLGQATLTAGSGILSLPALSAGSYTVTATYAGDTNDLPATSIPITFQVLSTATTTILTTPATAAYAASVTLSAAISPAPAAGLMRFFDNGNLLGSVALANGQATLTTATLAPGSHPLTATFSGDSTHDPSTGTATLAITADSSTTTLSLAQPALLAGSPAVVTVRVASSSAAIPTGTVTLRTGTTVLGSAALANGAAGQAYATLSIPTPSAGTYPVVAFYSGDPDTAPSDSSAVVLAYTVNPRIATGTLTLSATQVPPLTPVTLTAAFSSPATSGPALVPTGTVTFFQGANALATVPLDSAGRASFTPPAAALGTWTYDAAYSPTGVFTAAPVKAAILTVTPPLAVAFTDATVTMSPASEADAPATLTTLSGFQGAVATRCTTPQTYITCTIDAPSTVSGTATAKVHLAVSSKTATLSFPPGGTAVRTTTLTLALLLPVCFVRRRRLPALLTLLFAAALAISVTGCTEGGDFNVPNGTFVIQLTATAANTPTTATLTVKVQ